MLETQDERLVRRIAKRVRTEGRMSDKQWGREDVGGVLEAIERDPEAVDFYVKKQVVAALGPVARQVLTGGCGWAALTTARGCDHSGGGPEGGGGPCGEAAVGEAAAVQRLLADGGGRGDGGVPGAGGGQAQGVQGGPRRSLQGGRYARRIGRQTWSMVLRPAMMPVGVVLGWWMVMCLCCGGRWLQLKAELDTSQVAERELAQESIGHCMVVDDGPAPVGHDAPPAHNGACGGRRQGGRQAESRSQAGPDPPRAACLLLTALTGASCGIM